MDNRFMNGFWSGLIGGIASNVYSYCSYYLLKFTTLRYVDFASVLVYGELKRQVPEIIFAQIYQLGFSTFLGILYAYLLPKVSKKHYLFKGLYYGLVVWATIYGVLSLFRVPGLTYIPLKTAISNYINALIFGGILAITFKYLEDKN